MNRPDWEAWVDEPLNDLAGLALVVASCLECGQTFPASPRMRVFRCPPCRETAYRARKQRMNSRES